MNIIIFGKPGSGKGVQAEILSKRLSLFHLSTGKMFRNQMKEDTELGRKIKAVMESPDLVSDEIVNEVVAEEIKKSEYDGLLFDGYPRTLKQVEFFDKLLKIDHMLLLDVSDEVVIERMQKRQRIDPRTETSNKEKIVERLGVYEKLTLPVVERFKKEGRLNVIDAHGTIEEISKKLSEIVGGLD